MFQNLKQKECHLTLSKNEKFFYKGIDLNGKEISGYLLAEDKSIAENILNNKGIIIEKIVNHRFFLII